MYIISNYVATLHFPLNSATTKQCPTVHYWEKWTPQKSKWEKPPSGIYSIVGCCNFHWRKYLLIIVTLSGHLLAMFINQWQSCIRRCQLCFIHPWGQIQAREELWNLLGQTVAAVTGCSGRETHISLSESGVNSIHEGWSVIVEFV